MVTEVYLLLCSNRVSMYRRSVTFSNTVGCALASSQSQQATDHSTMRPICPSPEPRTTTRNRFTAEGLAGNTTDYFRVVAVGAAGTSPMSDPAQAKVA